MSAFGFADVASLLALARDQNGNSIIPLSASDRVNLIGISSADLDEADFILSSQ